MGKEPEMDQSARRAGAAWTLRSGNEAYILQCAVERQVHMNLGH